MLPHAAEPLSRLMFILLAGPQLYSVSQPWYSMLSFHYTIRFAASKPSPRSRAPFHASGCLRPCCAPPRPSQARPGRGGGGLARGRRTADAADAAVCMFDLAAQFPEIEAFVQETVTRHRLELVTCAGDGEQLRVAD